MKGYTPEDKALTNQENCGSIYYQSKLLKSFQRLCHIQLDLDILLMKLTAQIWYCI